MPLRFFRRIRLMPGVTLNWTLTGLSLSFGPPGSKVTVGGPQGTRFTAGATGTGLFYTTTTGAIKKRRREAEEAEAIAEEERGPARSAVAKMPVKDDAFIQACMALQEGREAEAIRLVDKYTDNADAMFVAGSLYMRQGDNEKAIARLQRALDRKDGLGQDLERLGISYACNFNVTANVYVNVYCRLRGTMLLLAECHQNIEDLGTALRLLKKLHALMPDDPLVKLSYVEVLGKQAGEKDQAAHQRIVGVVGDLPNDDEVHTALLLHKGMALNALGLNDAAKSVFTLALRRKKDRSPELLMEIRYNRAKALLAAGKESQARKDLEHIYQNKPGYEDVAELLGLQPA